MIILVLFSGMLCGGIAAGLTLLAGSSLFFAVVSYSLVGSVGMLLCSAFVALLEANSEEIKCHNCDDVHVSA